MPAKKIPQIRDFSKGRITSYSSNNALKPTNSVSDSFNADFDRIIGSGVVRRGTTPLNSVVASNKTPLGLGEFVGTGGSPNYLLSAYSGASNATVYYYNGSTWSATGLTTLNNSAEVRFATIGGRVFMVNGVDAMKSSVDGTTWNTTNCITTNSVVPSLIYRYSGKIITGGYSGFKDRTYLSSVIDPNATPTLTWNTDPSTGDWIDINPDDGDNVTGYADVSSVVIVFKSRNMYRLSVLNNSADPESIFNAGAVSQEAITKCQGTVYFFSGDSVYSTTGGYPTQISRLGVQDYIDAIPKSQWSSVSLGADTWNVYVSTGQITVNGLTNYYVLKFSVRDQSWSVHYYPVFFGRFSQYTDSLGRRLRVADSAGFVQTIGYGNTDNGTPRFYSIDTQEIEFGQRLDTKKITGHIGVFTRNAGGSTISVKEESDDWRSLSKNLKSPIDIFDDNVEGRFIKFRWSGTTSTVDPVFEGFIFPEVKNQGIIDDL